MNECEQITNGHNRIRKALIRLAPVWLACRWRIMGHPLQGRWPRPDLAFDILGAYDYSQEMQLLCAEVFPSGPTERS